MDETLVQERARRARKNQRLSQTELSSDLPDRLVTLASFCLVMACCNGIATPPMHIATVHRHRLQKVAPAMVKSATVMKRRLRMNSKDRMLTLGGKAGFVALLLTAGVACGQESDGLSSSELASEMNQICADNGEEFEAVGHPETFEQIAAMTPALIEIFDGTLARMDQLDAADADSEAFDEFVTLGRKQSELLGRLQIAAASEAGDDFEAVVGEMAVVAERSDELAISLGAAECVG